MNRRMLVMVMASAATALFVLVSVYTWATATAVGATPSLGRFALSAMPLVVAPMVGVALLRRDRPRHAAAVLVTAALVWLPVPASAVRLLVGGSSGVWTGSALLETAAYGALAVAATLATQLVATWPARTRPSVVAGLLAAGVVVGAVWPPVATPGSGTADWVRPLAFTAAEPGDAAVLALMALVIALVFAVGVTVPGRTGAVVLATAAAVLFVDHLGNLLTVSGDPGAALAPAGWAGLLGSLGLLLLAAGRLRDDDRPPVGSALVADPDAV